jgi:hypothetical protein
MSGSDIPTDLVFVDPEQIYPTFRIGLFAESGQGKTVGACTADDPIVVLSADRPSAYMFARKFHGYDGRPDHHWVDPDTGQHVDEPDDPDDTPYVLERAKIIRETRFMDWDTVHAVYRYIRDRHGTPDAVRTLIVDPVSNIFDYLVSIAPLTKRKGESDGPDYQWVNQQMMGFVRSLRPFDLNLVLVGHVSEQKPKKGTTEMGTIGPKFGGPSLVEQVMRELDICAHVELRPLPKLDEDNEFEEPRFISVGQVQTLDSNLICKDGTGSLGGFRVLNLSRWVEHAAKALAPPTDDVPWSPPTPREPGTTTQQAARALEPGTVPMPDLSKCKTRGGAVRKLKDAGCDCSDPFAPDNVNCPLETHGVPGAPAGDGVAALPPQSEAHASTPTDDGATA